MFLHRFSDLRRIDLSRIVNELLKRERPIPLEFIADGVFIRGSIDDYLTSRGVSSETTLRLDYLPASLPPTYSASYSHDAAINGVDVLSGSSPAGGAIVQSGSERVLSGSQDGRFRIWNLSSDIIAASPLGTDDPYTPSGIMDVKFVDPKRIVSADYQGKLTLWDYDENNAVLKAHAGLHGHRRTVRSLAVNSSSRRILSGSYDFSVGFWSTERSENPEAASSSQSKSSSKVKRVKKSSSSMICGPLSMLKGHTETVSSSIFSPTDSTVAYSVSEDHRVITWDLTTATAVDTRITPSSLFSLIALPKLGLLAVGASPHITLVDPRASARSITAMTLKGHSSRVLSLACDPDTDHGLLSGSHDSTCRIWDLRSLQREVDGSTASKSVFTLPRKGQEGKPKPEPGSQTKVLAVAWDRDVGIVSGGSDGNVDIHRPHQIAAADGR